MTTLEARQETQPLARERLKGRGAQGTGATRAVGTANGRSLASASGPGRRDGVHFPGAGAPPSITGRVSAFSGSREM
jgi:hypothetical protein